MAEAFLSNVRNEINGVKERHLVLICCPSTLIASQFFTKACTFCVPYYRTLMAKLLIASNTRGNTQGMFWKKKAQHYIMNTPYEVTKNMTKEAREKTERRFKQELLQSNLLLVDMLVGTYEMMCRALTNAEPEVKGVKMKYTLVFDELQEALTVTSPRFSASFRCLSMCADLFKKERDGGEDVLFLMMTGNSGILNQKSPHVSAFVEDATILEHESMPKMVNDCRLRVLADKNGWANKDTSPLNVFIRDINGSTQYKFVLQSYEYDFDRSVWTYTALENGQDNQPKCEWFNLNFPQLLKKHQWLYSLAKCVIEGRKLRAALCIVNNKDDAVIVDRCVVMMVKLTMVFFGLRPPTSWCEDTISIQNGSDKKLYNVTRNSYEAMSAEKASIMTDNNLKWLIPMYIK